MNLSSDLSRSFLAVNQAEQRARVGTLVQTCFLLRSLAQIWTLCDGRPPVRSWLALYTLVQLTLLTRCPLASPQCVGMSVCKRLPE
ncbi:hypothetical protein PBY51_001426 [Eleginops maclovinus]|uniref:Uncharacterized protein n=1 Tax=Eleginops maclovinus TaxID=56733 RepID=A0AAN8AD08_ELEMC|nr:hypothetical protein PBY51_001426 [Eleginops maclovinus]